MAADHGHNLDAFDALFDDDILAQLAADDRLTDRLIDIVETGLNVVELILASGDINSQLAALQKILPLATKVADKRQDATFARIGEELRSMFGEVFPNRQAIEDAYAPLLEPDDDADPSPGIVMDPEAT